MSLRNKIRAASLEPEFNTYLSRVINFYCWKESDLDYAVRLGADPRCNNDQPIMRVAGSGNIDLLHHLVKKYGADPHVDDEKPLEYATYTDENAMIDVLFKHYKADIFKPGATVLNFILTMAMTKVMCNEYGNTLYFACVTSNFTAIKKMIEVYGAGFDSSILLYVKTREIAKYFIDNSANPGYNNDAPFIRACQEANLDLMNFYVDECNVRVDKHINVIQSCNSELIVSFKEKHNLA